MNNNNQEELELKFEMDVGELKALQFAASKSAELVGNPEVRKLRSIYFDSQNFALRKRGLSLRVRDIDGQWVQTVKSKTMVKGGVSNPIETECLIDECVPVPALIGLADLREVVSEVASGEILLPVFETVVERTSYRLKSVHGGEAELAIDMGHIYSDKGLLPIGEAELELVSGGSDTLLHFASSLMAGRHFRLANENKATRGYVLIGAEAQTVPKPECVALPTVNRKQNSEDMFLVFADTLIGNILHNWAVTQCCEDPEGPEQLREGLKLFRSLLKAFDGSINGTAIENIDRRARDAVRLVDRLSDLDMLINKIYVPVALRGDQALSVSGRQLGDRMIRYRATVRRQVLYEMQNWPSASFLIELALFTKVAPWRNEGTFDAKQPIDEISTRALNKSYKRVLKWAKQLDHLSPNERRQMRQSLNRLHRQSLLFAPLYKKKRVGRFNEQMIPLQHVFNGFAHVALASRMADVARDAGPATEKDSKVIQRVMKKSEKRARKGWRDARMRWSELESAKKFWN